MYYCRNCKKVVKEGNKCSCGNELTRKDEIIYCPTCNKMYFKPSKSFTCKKCNSYVKVEPDAVASQNQGAVQNKNVNAGANVARNEENVKASSNSAYANMFLNESAGSSSGSNVVQKDSVNVETGAGSNDKESGYINLTYEDFMAQRARESQQNANNQLNSSNEKFPHKAFDNQLASESQVNVGGQAGKAVEQKKVKSVDDDFDTSLFEDAVAEKSKGGKKNKGKSDGDGSASGNEGSKGSDAPSKVTLLSIALIFVCALVLVFYVFILPHLSPTYRQNWERFVDAENAQYKAYGIDKSISTASFDVEDEGNDVVIATVKVDEKTYNSETKKYESVLKTYKVEFIKKNGEFVIKSMTEITE